MKTIFSLLIAILFTTTSYGQIVCRIFYDYDAAGNRVKRYYKCYDPNVPDQQAPGSWLTATLYPNPTTGPVVISFDELVDQAVINVVDMAGHVLLVSEYSKCYEVNFDLSQYPPGTYVVNLDAMNGQYSDHHVESFTIVKADEDMQ